MGRLRQDTRHRYILYIKRAIDCRMRPWDLSLVGRSITNTTTTSKGPLYKRIYLNILFVVVIHIVDALYFSFLCSFLKRKVIPSASDFSTYWYRGRGTAGSRDNGHTSIYFHSFSCPT